MLLVLDNLEHVIQAAKELASMLCATPRVKLLATSRQALNLRE
jgi:predicted ATPase